MDWPEEYAQALAAGLTLGDEETRVMLRLAREVAHRTERKNAPVATYVAGMYVAERVRGGVAPRDAARDALRVAESILPPAEAAEPGA